MKIHPILGAIVIGVLFGLFYFFVATQFFRLGFFIGTIAITVIPFLPILVTQLLYSKSTQGYRSRIRLMAYGVLSFVAEMMMSIVIINGKLNIARMMTVVVYATIVSALGAIVIVAFRGRMNKKSNPELLDD